MDFNYSNYKLDGPAMVELQNMDEDRSMSFKKNADGLYEKSNNSDTKEAVLLCAGQLQYERNLGDKARFGVKYDFYPNFELIRECLKQGDLVVGNLNTMVRDDYITTEMYKSDYSANEYYSNARTEYLEAIKSAGFDCLALANPVNLDTGVEGIGKTEKNVLDNGMLPLGIGHEKYKMFDINGIKIAILSYTFECKHIDDYITKEGAELLLNKYSKERAEKDIAEVKSKGANFVLVYLNCGDKEIKIKRPERQALGEEIAEAGADYIICTIPKYVSRVVKYKTKDGRETKIATSIGDFMTGIIYKEDYFAALLRLRLFLKEDGTVEVCDDAIPLKHFSNLDSCNLAVAPALKAFYPEYKSKNFKNVAEKLSEKLSDNIKIADDKKITILSKPYPQYTYEEFYKLLGKEPSNEDKEILDMNAPIKRIATRRPELKEGCVAVLAEHTGYIKDKYQITIDDAVNAGASLIVANETTDKVPCIQIPGNLKEECRLIFGNIVDRYKPFTVAITGTAGKTTTKELASCVFDTHYKTMHVKGNFNQFYTCCSVIQKLDPTYKAYVQEVHGGSFNAAKDVSTLIKPDVAIITSIGEGHLLDLGTLENIIQAKLEIAEGIKDTGVLIVNDDNEHLKGLQMEGKRIIRYGIDNPECDYYATNIENHGETQRFDIVSKEGSWSATLNMQGLHNISNSLAVFAAAIEAGIPPYKIIAGLSHYIPDSDKQRMINFGGYNMILDTYSATPISMESALKTLSAFPVEEGVKKIAVLGDIPALGKSALEKHKEVAENLLKYDYDVMLCVGEFAKYFAYAAQREGREAYAFEDREEFNRKLVEVIRPGDFILFKSGTRSHLKEETIYPIFGLIDKYC